MADPIESALVELVQLAEEPLYPAYLEMIRLFGHAIDLAEFLHTVDRMLQEGIVRLWHTDSDSHDRTELYRVPESLLAQYHALDQVTEKYDRLGLSLTRGDRANPHAEPAWSIECDFVEGRFKLTMTGAAEADIFDQLSRYFPDVRFQVTSRSSDLAHSEVWGQLSREG